MSNSSIISNDMAIKFYKLTRYMAELFSNECDECYRVGCLFLSKTDFEIQSTGVSTIIYEDQTKRITKSNKKIKLYTMSAVENGITRAAKSGTSLDDTIAIITQFPSITSLKLLIQSGVNTIVTVPYSHDYDKKDYECLNLILESVNLILLDIGNHPNHLLNHHY